jgi:nucleoid-associated protein YgaU
VALQFRKPPERKSAADASVRTQAAQRPTFAANAAPPLDLFTGSMPQAGAAADPATRFAAAAPDANPTPQPNPSPSPSPNTSNAAPATHDYVAPSAVKPAESAVPELPPNFSGVDRADRTGPTDSPTEANLPTHKIVDGDSLPLLAERYLGSASRAGEIFACNRDVLSDPELLPIGSRLRIPTGPPRPAVATEPPANATSDAARLAVNSPPPHIAGEAAKTAPLLDIAAPALSPLPPLGAPSGSPGKIYIVQTGDTLPSIAQAVYGDSRRTDAILQANRDQLRSEQDLRPGMLLETR